MAKVTYDISRTHFVVTEMGTRLFFLGSIPTELKKKFLIVCKNIRNGV